MREWSWAVQLERAAARRPYAGRSDVAILLLLVEDGVVKLGERQELLLIDELELAHEEEEVPVVCVKVRWVAGRGKGRAALALAGRRGMGMSRAAHPRYRVHRSGQSARRKCGRRCGRAGGGSSGRSSGTTWGTAHLREKCKSYDQDGLLKLSDAPRAQGETHRCGRGRSPHHRAATAPSSSARRRTRTPAGPSASCTSFRPQRGTRSCM